MNAEQVLDQLRSLANPNAAIQAARFGIDSPNTYGIAAPVLKKMAKTIGRDHALAEALWATGNLDARIIACLVDDPALVTEPQMERWVNDLDSWSICDCACGYLFDKTPWAYAKAVEWCGREAEYVKRAGFAMMAELAVLDKAASDTAFMAFLPTIKRGATDERNFV
ncbi:MAG: DNA alkylation repair protein, partial [Chloroflexi bacterium]|nr:DNA alkylation repair protein [Chloroflexota bacterium]